jgi:N6-adenosine-specific RNA methylase IME4
MQLEKAINLPKCHIEKNGLLLDDTITKDEWHDIGGVLKTMEGCIQFWIGDWLRFGEKKWGEMYKEAEEKTGLENKTLRNIKSISDSVDLSRRRDKLSFNHHAAVAALPENKQDKMLDMAEKKEMSVSELRAAVRDEKHKDEKAQPLPAGKYQTIVIDPPWEVGSMVLDKWDSPITDKYPTMTIQQITDMDIPNLSHENCSLFMWTTHTFLPDALSIINKWGFKYHCCITWDKIGGFSLCGFHRRTEFCLYSYKGKININQTGEFIPTIIQEAKRKHSQKPEIFDKFMLTNTAAPRIEIFARVEKEGFDAWGNQL